MKKLLVLLLAAVPALSILAQEELTTTDAKALIKATSKHHVTVHDPSVVWEPNLKRYYIFGSHKAGAYTTDLQNWTEANPSWTPSANSSAFTSPAVTKVRKGGVEVDFPQFNAMEWSARTDAAYNIDGNMWAPDVIWNERMQKWCMYLSINGDSWHSSIILLTSNNIQGPYRYQGPVVICGFQDAGHSYKGTDLELALGQTLSSLPSRYNVGNGWGRRWPHTIDPAAFYDEQGKLWLVYGSWSGGIWMLELDEDTGLRDYDVVYPSTNGSSDGVTSDPYFGKKIAGGYYVSGEGPYIEHIGEYYYLFVSYGFFDSVGGYVMRMFRSENPDGPYTDASGRNAIFDTYRMNYGKNADNRGVKVMGAYAGWGNMELGELSQGHNSIIAAEDGRTYLVYHTRFDNGTEGHQVRVHQMFMNKNGWLVASPFEYNGEQLTDQDVSSRWLFTAEQIAGTYQLLLHKYAIDYANRETVKPVEVTFNKGGTVSGAYTGTWTVEHGYITLMLGGITYNGVIIEQQMDGETSKTISFTALANSGLTVWGYKLHPKYALAKQVKEQTVPVKEGTTISKDVDLYADMNLGINGVTVSWKSSMPSIISDYGKYNPTGLTERQTLTLTARAETPGYFWQEAYNVKAAAETVPTADWQTGMVAHYGFDDEALANTFNAAEKAQLLSNSTTQKPTLTDNEPLRTYNAVQLYFGANGKESYIEMPNPLFGKTLDNGATISFWVKRSDDNLWDAFFGFANGNARFYMTGNSYVGYNSGTGNYIDINHPSDVQPAHILVGRWQLITLCINKSGVTLYVNGSKKNFAKFKGQQNGTDFTASTAFDYQQILSHLSGCPTFCMGKGSFWGSPAIAVDDVIIYDRMLSLTEVMALSSMENRVFDFYKLNPDAITTVKADQPADNQTVYDLQGRRVSSPRHGLYIKNGRKVVVK